MPIPFALKPSSRCRSTALKRRNRPVATMSAVSCCKSSRLIPRLIAIATNGSDSTGKSCCMAWTYRISKSLNAVATCRRAWSYWTILLSPALPVPVTSSSTPILNRCSVGNGRVLSAPVCRCKIAIVPAKPSREVGATASVYQRLKTWSRR